MGIGTSKNKALAFDCYSKSAQAGNVNAQVSLAKCYLDGKGTLKIK